MNNKTNQNTEGFVYFITNGFNIFKMISHLKYIPIAFLTSLSRINIVLL